MTLLATTDKTGGLWDDPGTTSADPTDGATMLIALTQPAGGGVAASDDCHRISNTLSGSIWRVAGGGTTIYPGGGG